MKSNSCAARCCIEPLEARIAPAALATIPLSSLDGTNGFKLSGVSGDDNVGQSVSALGDINGDGFNDFAVDSIYAGGSGAAYVIYGAVSGFPANFALASLSTATGFKITGASGDLIGLAIAPAGDVNGDHIADIVLTAEAADANGLDSGAAYVVYGKVGTRGTLDLATVIGTNGFRIAGGAAGDHMGNACAAGDVNHDGFSDLVIGAENAQPNGQFSGAAYVVFGKAAFPASVAVTALDGTNGFKFSGAMNDLAGTAVSAVDLNGDGFSDVVISAPVANANGTTYVIFGKASAFSANLTAATLGTGGFAIVGVASGDHAGISLRNAGDVDGNGVNDLIIGAFEAAGAQTFSGAAYVLFGKHGTFSNINLSTLNGTNGFKLSGVAMDDEAGLSVSGGDVNGDGLSDLVIGAPDAGSSGGTVDPGAVYVVFGKSAGIGANVNLGSLDGTNGFTIIHNVTRDFAGNAVSAGDVNGDGFADVIVGVPGIHGAGTVVGAADVIFGFNSGAAVAPTISGKTTTFTDVDGDLVTVKVSKGALAAGDFTLLHPLGAVAGGAQLVKLDVTGDANFLPGAAITITAKRGPLGGDGHVNVGAIDATGIDLGAVSIPGDLGRIDAGTGSAMKPAMVSLTVQSLGAFDRSTQDTGATLTSDIFGALGKLVVKTNIDRATIIVSVGATPALGKIGSISIGGDLIGGDDRFHIGQISATGDIGSATVKFDVVGASRDNSALISTLGHAGPISIGGSLRGGAGSASGSVNAANGISSVKIKHDVIGGSGALSGAIYANGPIGSISIGGDLRGGAGIFSGTILTGSNGPGMHGPIGSVTIGGDLVGGASALNGIFADTTLGAVKIGGNVRGSESARVTIAANGNLNPATTAAALAIKGVNIAGSVEHARILAGYPNTLDPVSGNPAAQIGAVSVKGDWIASDLAAGIDFGVDQFFGNNAAATSDDGLIAASNLSGISSRIASIVIGGQVLGTPGGGDHFAFTAQQIGSFHAGAFTAVLTAGTDTPIKLSPAADVTLREVM